MKEILAPILMASVMTFAFATPAQAHATTQHQRKDWATVMDGPATNHDRVRIQDAECDGNAVRVEAVLSDDSRYTMWNLDGCRTTHVSELNKGIVSYRVCEADRCSPWKDA